MKTVRWVTATRNGGSQTRVAFKGFGLKVKKWFFIKAAAIYRASNHSLDPSTAWVMVIVLGVQIVRLQKTLSMCVDERFHRVVRGLIQQGCEKQRSWHNSMVEH